jgi:flagellar basal-body rod protein FlgF
MEKAGYATLTRQAGLLREMQVVANNIANAATTGYRQEGVIFSEYVTRAGDGPSLSMATARVRNTALHPGQVTETGGPLDLAIEGAGFFRIETPDGERLTRAGNFKLSPAGDMVTNAGFRLLDAGGAPVFVPPDATDLTIAADGTISVDGRPLGQIGLVRPAAPIDLLREDGVMFRTEGPLEPVAEGRIRQGALEQANVDPVAQITRMIEVQRAYEMGQSFLDAEDQRLRSALRSFTR